ncbi:thioredoxin family protein [Eubacteriales bacterium OttesenSCG-928-A19]|nr:thioredoxin family protein [Eubacteriales bacterium OttesenSCG-928-A19]
MALFGKKKRASTTCDCGGCCDAKSISVENMEAAKRCQQEGARVKILGSGCKKCIDLEANTKAALAQLGMDTTIDHVTDFGQIAAYGVMTTPALVVDGKVLAYGKVIKIDEIVMLLKSTKSEI